MPPTRKMVTTATAMTMNSDALVKDASVVPTVIGSSGLT